MKNKDKARKDTISSLIGAVKKTAIDKKCKDNITEALVDEVILKEKKTVQEMIDTCPVDRTELLQEYKDRMVVIDEFAPKLMTDATEIQNVITTLLSDTQVKPVKANKGQIMKVVMPVMKGKADMKIVNKVIEKILE
jgi:uncharacterized protein YqeY